MGKFVRGTFTVLGIIEFLAFIRIYIEEVNVPFSSKMTILVAAIIFTFLGYIPEKIYKNYIKKCINKYYEEQFLKEEEQFLKEEKRFGKENRSFNEPMQEPSSQNQNHNNIQNSFNNILEKKSNDNIRDYSEDKSLKNGIKSEIESSSIMEKRRGTIVFILIILMYIAVGTYGYSYTTVGGIGGVFACLILLTLILFVPILGYILAAIIGYAIAGISGLIVGCIGLVIIKMILDI